jgi:pilus assembly protein Flp/PilA
MKALLERFLRDDNGATAIEYGLIAAGISVAILAAVQTVGGGLQNTFNYIGGQLSNASR